MAVTTTLSKTNLKIKQMVFGMPNVVGAKFKVFEVTVSSVSAQGDAIDLSAHFSRIFLAFVMNSFAKDASTGYVGAAYTPGTAKTDQAGGWSPSDGKIHILKGATGDFINDTSDQSAHVVYLVVCGS